MWEDLHLVIICGSECFLYVIFVRAWQGLRLCVCRCVCVRWMCLLCLASRFIIQTGHKSWVAFDWPGVSSTQDQGPWSPDSHKKRVY